MNKYDTTEQKSIVTSFINEIKLLTNAKNCLNLAISDHLIFETNNAEFQVINGFDWQTKISEGETFDFILGNLPLCLDKIDYIIGNEKFNILKDWAEILSAVKFLKTDGLGIFPLRPSSFRFKKLENLLNLEGYFVNSIFNAPEGILIERTILTPIFILISQKQVEQIFIAELLNEQQAKEVVTNYFAKSGQENLKNGMYIQPGSYRGFNQIKIQHQIKKLKTQYKEYEEYSIGELATEINDVRYMRDNQNFMDIKNSLYIPKIGNSPVISNLSDIPSEKHHNYFQVVFGEKVINEYLRVFFLSTLGKLIRQSLSFDSFKISKVDLEKAIVPLPSIEYQNQILNTQRKLIELKEAVDEFDKELSLNPTTAISVLEQLDKMIEVLGTLTEEDKVRNFIRQGESKTIEFKATFSLDLEKQTKEKHIELSALKTIVAFLNTEGGILLIGVNDKGEEVGVSKEIDKFHKGSHDKFLLHVKNRIKERIGEQYYLFIDKKLINISENIILFIECKKSDSPCYLDESEFYVRTNPATDQLHGRKQFEYIKTRFKNNLSKT